ncbi:hypothetical protein cypCar_00021938 [Cyprinus carpio]|nr:hypothetical protein cypCar_00021938 [Cyprinus carpio]
MKCVFETGSTDCICYATVGSNDPVTSALHIIVGDSQAMDICSVHNEDRFLRYSVSLLGYGFYGDVLTDSERKRWMGPARYDISGVVSVGNPLLTNWSAKMKTAFLMLVRSIWEYSLYASVKLSLGIDRKSHIYPVFDHSFVEVYRVKQFRFSPRYQECDSEVDLRESGVTGKRFLSQICREHRACGCMPSQSNWNCDGEILPHTAIQVR